MTTNSTMVLIAPKQPRQRFFFKKIILLFFHVFIKMSLYTCMSLSVYNVIRKESPKRKLWHHQPFSFFSVRTRLAADKYAQIHMIWERLRYKLHLSSFQTTRVGVHLCAVKQAGLDTWRVARSLATNLIAWLEPEKSFAIVLFGSLLGNFGTRWHIVFRSSTDL